LAAAPPSSAADLILAKLAPPDLPPHVVARTALVNRLRAAGSAPVASIVAPTGYGKTTLMCQWAARDRRPFAWVSLDAHDDDPRTLLEYIATALDRIETLDPSVFRALRSSRSPVWTVALPRLVSALGKLSPVVLALDDVDHLRSKECAEVLSVLAQSMGPSSRLALAGRSAPAALVARLRVHGQVLELGSADLALSPREARLLLEAADVDISPDEVLELTHKTEGWAAGLYLASLSFKDRSGNGSSPGSFGGDDRFVADYLRQEHLSRLTPKERAFVIRSAVLRQMSAPLCDAVLERRDSARTLQALERANLFLVPLDHRREWFRYNRVFREFLLAELRRDEPELVPELNRRAADWWEAHGALDDAIDYAEAAGDSTRMARLVTAVSVPGKSAARIGRLEDWFDQLDEPQLLAGNPALSVQGSWHHAFSGRPLDARRWADAAEHATLDGPLPDGCTSTEPWLRVLRAARCEQGVEAMRTDAEAALTELPFASPWRATALLELGVATLLAGNDAEADSIFCDASEAAFASADACTGMAALAERSLLAAARNDHDLAVQLARRARAVAEELALDGHALRALEIAASARAALRSDAGGVRDDLARATSLAPALTHAVPWLAVQVDLELARTELALGDLESATVLLDAADEILRRVPDLGVLVDIARDLRARAGALAASSHRDDSGLTAAELRLLPHLTTHLSFREIGELLFVSRNTVKTQAISVYRKLGVSSRSEAIAHAAELGLVDPSALSHAGNGLSRHISYRESASSEHLATA
jgi:LuxR family maltose regulon positive regulatory protein